MGMIACKRCGALLLDELKFCSDCGLQLAEQASSPPPLPPPPVPSVLLPKQDVSMKLEIHFHTQEEASVFIENNVVSPQESNFAEIYIFTLYTLRQLATLDEPESGQLAGLLSTVSSVIKEMSRGYKLGGVELVRYPGYQGRKMLFAKFSFGENGQSFFFDIKGFGSGSSGIGYYSPISVSMLLRYLAIKHASDSDFLRRLAMAAEMCGQSHIDMELNIYNQSHVGFVIMGSVLHS